MSEDDLFKRLVAISILVLLSCTARGIAAGSPAPADCSGMNDPAQTVISNPDDMIQACTRIIQGAGSVRERAIASINRAIAFKSRAGTGSTSRLRSDFDSAAEDFDEAVHLDPKFAFARYARGSEQLFHDLDAALADFNEAMRLDPNYALAYQGRARAFSLKDDYDRAGADYNSAIRLDPTLALSYAGRGSVSRLKGDNDAAITDFTQAMGLGPKDSPAYRTALIGRGIVYFQKGDFDHAIVDFDEAIRAKPTYGYGFEFRGVAQLLRGSMDLAREDLKRATELDPKDANAALWREIADRRSHSKGRLAEAAARLDMSAWPAHVVNLFLGKPTFATILADADDSEAWRKHKQVCEAYVFSGELALLTDAKTQAAEAFKSAAQACAKGNLEWGVAAAELRNLGAKP